MVFYYHRGMDKVFKYVVDLDHEGMVFLVFCGHLLRINPSPDPCQEI